MAIGSKDLTPGQLRGLEEQPLADALTEAKRELFNLRFQSATGQLDNHGRLRAVRRDIARIYTEMRERELSIGRVQENGTEQAGTKQADSERDGAEQNETEKAG